jgi:hypothetical protein
VKIHEIKSIVEETMYGLISAKYWESLSNVFKVQFNATLIVPLEKNILDECPSKYIFILDEDLVPWSLAALPQAGMTYTVFCYAKKLNQLYPDKYPNKTGYYVFKNDKTVPWK